MQRDSIVPRGVAANTVRLVHLKQPRAMLEPCDVCGGACDKPTHWRVRAHIAPPDQGSTSVVAHACSEPCARSMADALRVEISLTTGERPQMVKYETQEPT